MNTIIRWFYICSPFHIVMKLPENMKRVTSWELSEPVVGKTYKTMTPIKNIELFKYLGKNYWLCLT